MLPSYVYMKGVLFDMRKIRVYIIACILMLITVLVALAVLSSFIYLLKWKADMAMAGIIVIYILSGFVGGKSLSFLQKRLQTKNGQLSIAAKALEALLLSSIFLCILMIISIFILRIPFGISVRFLLIVLLFAGSCFVGRIL